MGSNLLWCIQFCMEWAFSFSSEIKIECLKRVWNFKNSTFEEHILIFVLWKWIKYIFALTICIKKMPGVRSIAMKLIELLYPGASFSYFFYYSSYEKKIKSKWCRIWFKYRSCSFTFWFFWIINKKCIVEYVRPPIPPKIHIYRYILDIKHYFHQISKLSRYL